MRCCKLSGASTSASEPGVVNAPKPGDYAKMHLLASTGVAAVIFFATLVGLVENVVIFFVTSRQWGLTVRSALLSLPIMLVGLVALVLLLLFGPG